MINVVLHIKLENNGSNSLGIGLKVGTLVVVIMTIETLCTVNHSARNNLPLHFPGYRGRKETNQESKMDKVN